MPDDPSVPIRWPYARRASLPPPTRREGVALPSLGGGWTLVAAPGLDFEAGAGNLEGAFGRGGVLRSGDVVLRPYRRGGLVRHVNRSTYAGLRRFQSEFEVHARLWELGFPTVEPLGYAFRRRGLGYQGVYLTRHADATPWPRSWEQGDDVLHRIGTLLGALAALRLWAPDLNATNLLLDPEGGLLALDWDRAAFDARGDLLAAYAGRLRRSLRRLGAPENLWPEVERAIFQPESR